MKNILKNQKQLMYKETKILPYNVVDVQTGGHKVYKSYASSVPVTSLACFKKIAILMDKHKLDTENWPNN